MGLSPPSNTSSEKRRLPNTSASPADGRPINKLNRLRMTFRSLQRASSSMEGFSVSANCRIYGSRRPSIFLTRDILFPLFSVGKCHSMRSCIDRFKQAIVKIDFFSQVSLRPEIISMVTLSYNTARKIIHPPVISFHGSRTPHIGQHISQCLLHSAHPTAVHYRIWYRIQKSFLSEISGEN